LANKVDRLARVKTVGDSTNKLGKKKKKKRILHTTYKKDYQSFNETISLAHSFILPMSPLDTKDDRKISPGNEENSQVPFNRPTAFKDYLRYK